MPDRTPEPSAESMLCSCAQLAAVEAIRALKARYFRAMDTQDWAELREVFAESATAGVGLGQMRGREQIVTYIAGNCEGVRSAHHGHNPEITVTGQGTARAVWAMSDYFELRGTEPLRGFTGLGYYDDTYVFEDARWRIATTQLRRIKIDPLPGGLPDFYQNR